MTGTSTDRSTSRGREPLTSSGRGGLGNIRPPSTSRDRPLTGPDDFSSTRGREPAVAPSPEPRSTGRGGALTVAGHARRAFNSAAPQVHSSGRGGAGNIAPGPPPAYERGRSGQAPVEGVHLTGRGGLANLTSAPAPPLDAVAHHPGAYESTGRGGVGNMSRSRERGSMERRPSGSIERGSLERSGSKDRGDKGGIAGLWGRMHGHGHGWDQPETIREGGGEDVRAG
ncbi:hypothetical protein C8R43DRAFT_1244332 [Mycena crocata]|nr:hypothetical protein C8R43DRAFT_1244332 [Mycena crocata]